MCTKPIIILKYSFFIGLLIIWLFFICNRKSFRPAYGKLDLLASMFAKTPIIIICPTPTATKIMQQKIEETLGLIRPIVIYVNPVRKNIHFSSSCRDNQGNERQVNILDLLLKNLRDKRQDFPLTIININSQSLTLQNVPTSSQSEVLKSSSLSQSS